MIVSPQANSNNPRCPQCGSEKIRRYSPVNLWENMLSLVGIHPYQCSHYTCQHRFYRKFKPFAASNEESVISSVSENLYGGQHYQILDNQHLVDRHLLGNLYDSKKSDKVSTETTTELTPKVISNNVTHYNFRSESSVLCRKFLTLTWYEHGRKQTHTITSESKNGHPNRVTLGRDPSRCDLVFVDRTVSGLNAEIYFDDSTGDFWLRNLRPINSPFINNQKVISSACLEAGVTLYLGKVAITVEIENDYYDLEPTLLFDRGEHSA
jgi:hypothetical protein